MKGVSRFTFALLFVLPASANYQLRDFGYGSGGASNAQSSHYALEGIVGEVNADTLQGTNYDLGAGLQYVNQAHVPPAPAFTNFNDYYNKLKLTLATGNNPSDTQFAIAISTDNFVSDTRYVQNDATLGSTLGVEDYQTYSAWGGASGFFVIGLAVNTTYTAKVKAWQGKFTETAFGPTATAATVGQRLSFDIDVAATDSDTNPPFATHFGDLMVGTVTDSPEKIWVDFSTNGESGGRVYIVADHAGLTSLRAGYTIGAVTGNLTNLTEGFGAQGTSATQISGGPFAVATAYNLSSNNVATADTTIRELFTAAVPVTGGRGSFLLKAKSSAVTPAASDYSEILSVIASAGF